MLYLENRPDISAKSGSIIAVILALILICSLPAGCLKPLKWELFVPTDQAIYPGRYWQKAETPEQLGWSSKKLAQAQAYSRRIGSAAVMIVENGVVVDAWGDIARNYKCHSMRKSLISALIGIHVAEGRIDLGKTLADLGIDDYPPSLTAKEKTATVGDLIKARSGVYHAALGENPGMKALKPARNSHSPGTFWYYNNWDFNALGTIFEQETGRKIFDEFDARFAVPLGMEDFRVENCYYRTRDSDDDEKVSMHRYYFFRMSSRDLARFGLLFLRKGSWQNRQILSPAWIKESTASHSSRSAEGGYGYMWWTGNNTGLFQNVTVKAHSYFASGYGGQRLIILPQRNLVVVHRVDTEADGRHVYPHQIGRLLWHIMDAAGETRIGGNPALFAAKGTRLNADGLKTLLTEDTGWTGPNNGVIPGGSPLVLRCFKDGTMTFAAGKDVVYKGTWTISEDQFHCTLMGMTEIFYIVQDRDGIMLYDEFETLFCRLEAIPEQ